MKKVLDYNIHEKIGGGGMGTVYRCTHPVLNKDFAVKFLNDDLTSEPDFIEKFQMEARLMANIENENIVKVHYYGIENGKIFYIMDYIEGHTLEEISAEYNQLTAAIILIIIKQIAEAVKYLHNLPEQIIHCDLKPTNIFLCNDNIIKIADFGIAITEKETLSLKNTIKTVRKDTISFYDTVKDIKKDKFEGTIAFIPPEYINERIVTPSFDIYSIGVIFYKLCCSKIPAGIFEMPSELNPDYPAEIDSIIKKCLYADPEKRYRKIEDLIYDIDNLSNKTPLNPVESQKKIQDSVEPDTLYKSQKDSKDSLKPDINIKSGEYAKESLTISTPPSPILELITKDTALDYIYRDIAYKKNLRKETRKTKLFLVKDEKDIIKYLTGRLKKTENMLKKSDVTFAEFVEVSNILHETANIRKKDSEIFKKIGKFELEKIINQFNSLKDRIIENRNKTMALVPEMECWIGSYTGNEREKPVHKVYIQSFYLDKTPVTVYEYKKIFPDWQSSSNFDDYKFPVTEVSYNETVEYAKKIGKRLPSEVEWEAAAKMKADFKYSFGSDYDISKANVNKPFSAGPEIVTKYAPNFLGLYCMTGNVWEWTSDWLMGYPGNLKSNPLFGFKYKVLKGGCWTSTSDTARNSYRHYANPETKSSNIGFRCALYIDSNLLHSL